VKYSIITFGCRVNQADSMAIEAAFRARGAVHAPPDAADVLVVNTCSVTSTADQGARQTIRRVVRANPAIKVVVTGCYATRRPAEVGALPNVTHVITNPLKDRIVDTIAADIGLTTAERFGDGDGACGQTLVPGVAGRTALTLCVQTGCDERCSYCIIPTTRGASRSRPLEQVLEDVRRAVNAGYKEIVITGVHLGSYGRDLPRPSSLSELLRTLATCDADVLFRVSSLEPMDCTGAIVDCIAQSTRLAPHFHLPLQHGCDDVLRRMNRPYTVDYYRRLVENIRRALPLASIGSDIIVGFPGETEAEFAEMRQVVSIMPLTYLHVFPYSDRPGTVAAGLSSKVDGSAIRERARQIRAIGDCMAREFRRTVLGRSLRGLTVDDGSAVVTENYLKVRLSEPKPRNEWVQVRIDASEPIVAGTAV
jgi:threonylcarbamoyladenosine tRNA methylthiotransferase MtaB